MLICSKQVTITTAPSRHAIILHKMQLPPTGKYIDKHSSTNCVL